MQALLLTAVFVGTVSLMVGAYVFLNRRRLAATDAARRRLRTIDALEETPTILREGEVASAVPLLNRVLAGRSFVEELQGAIQRAGATLTPGAFLMLVVLGAMAGGMLGGQAVPGGLGAAFGAIVGSAIPFWWLKRKRKKWLSAFEAQLPEAMDMLVSALRSGYSFQAAMRFIGDEVPRPLGPEFTRFYDEQRLGMDVRVALLGLQDRVESLDLKMFVTAVLLQRETGGNLSEILTNITALMRERVAVRGHIETLTAEPKLSAKLLAALPVLVFFGLSLIDKELMRPMTETALGRMLLIVAAVMVTIGYLILNQLADVDF